MSRMLNLADRLLAMGRLFQDMGRKHDACRLYTRLIGLRDLPARTAEEAQLGLAAIHLDRQKYRQARRHLAAAIALRPDNARSHYLMATAVDFDDDGDPEIALKHYRRSLELAPDQPECLSDFGLLAVCLGQNKEGLAALRRAVDLAPDDLEVAAKLVEGLCQLERPEEARLTLRAALFRHPRHGGFRKLWNDFQFQQVREQQEETRRQTETNRLQDSARMILPFVPRTGGETQRPWSPKVLRHEAVPATLSWSASWPDQRHA